MFSLPNDPKIDLSDMSSIVGIDGFLVEPGKYRAVISKKFQLNQDGPEIEASVGVKLVGHEADDGLLESITKYNDKQNRIKDDRRRDARERSRKNSFEYKSPPKPPRTSNRASNGRGWSEQKAFRRYSATHRRPPTASH